jgi:ribosomal protein L9
MNTRIRRFTPVKIFEILTDVKNLCEKNEFLPKNYCKKEPSIWHITRVLVKKGILVRKNNEYIWESISPNMEMARAVIKEYLSYAKFMKEQRQENHKTKKEKFVAEKIEFLPLNDNLVAERPIENLQKPFDLLEHFEYVNKIKTENEQLMLENLELKANINNLFIDLQKKDSEIERRGKILHKFENELNDNEEEISDLSTSYKQLKKQIEQIKTLSIEKPTPKKVKLFGMTILKIE